MWNTLGIIAGILLIAYWRRRTAVWGGFTIGIFAGIIAGIVTLIKAGEFDWLLLLKIATGGVLLGFFAEILPLVTRKLLGAPQKYKEHSQVGQSANEEHKDIKYLLNYKDELGKDYIFNLLEQYKNAEIIYEPLRKTHSKSEEEKLFSYIDKAAFLSTQEKAEAIIALMMILDGSIPGPDMLSLIGKLFGKDFVETIEAKRKEIEADSTTGTDKAS